MAPSLLVAGLFVLVTLPTVDGVRRHSVRQRRRKGNQTWNVPEFTVSGHSSGGSMASQHFFAYSDVAQGLGHFQAAPYACKSLPNRNVCTKQPSGISVSDMAEYAEQQAQAGNIAPLEGMRQRPIWVFAGGSDSIVLPLVCTRAAELYSRYSNNVESEQVSNAQHAYVTDGSCPSNVCNGCSALRVPFLNDCGYDMAGNMLAHVLGRQLAPRVAQVNAHFLEIDQSQFFPSGMSAQNLGMNTRAFAYIPASCRANPDSCAIHVMYHGCSSSIDSYVGDRVYKHWGGNGWAESNQLLMLYPQTHSFNCWDWTGTQANVNDPQHDTRDGMQINTVNRMVSALRGLVVSSR